jgi:hypothetical protein
MTTSIPKYVVLVALGLWLGGSLLGSPVGSVAGTVKDPSGAFVPGVKVTLTNTSTNAKLETTTNANGEFQFLQLAPATYGLVAETQGFRQISVPSVLVQVDQITHVDLSLEVGSVTESVQVAAVAPLLENDKSTLSSVVNSQDIATMPLNARQVLDLALVTPGVVPTAAGTQVQSFNVAGARSQSNIYLWDGVSNMDTQVDGALNNFRITDAIQEFSVQTSVASAEFGRGTGGEVNVVTKSGTNQLHGSLFEYLRNSDLDAADFFTNRNRAPKNPLHRNQYGTTLGGPIKHDKTFVFGSYEGFRQVAPTVSTTRVPTDAERAQVTDPISRNLLQFWPVSNTSVSGSANNFIANVGATNFDNTGVIKIDQLFSGKDALSGRFADYQGTTFTPGPLPLLGGTGNTPVSRNGALVETHTFSPTLLNEFRIGYSRNQTFITVQDNGFNAASVFQLNGQPLAGVVDGTKNLQDSGLPTIMVSGGFARLGSTSNYPQGRITNTIELFDNVSWIAPFHATKHSFRFGYHIRREQARRYLDGSERGVFNFVNWSDFAAGLVNMSTFRSGSTLAYWDRFPFDLYWQDQYKVKENLTINYGVRYEYPSAIYQTRQDATNFLPGVGPVLLATNQLLSIDPTKLGPASLVRAQAPATVSDSGVYSDKNNLAPVVGIAYTPRFAPSLFGNSDTVIRAGFRVGYDDIFNNIPANMGLNPPYNLTTSHFVSTTQPKFPWATGYDQSVRLVKLNASGQPTVGLLAFNAEDPNIRSAYLYQYNLGIQRRLGNDFSLEVDYQGSAGHKLGLFVDQNQPAVTVNNPALRGNHSPNVETFPYPLFGPISTGKDIGNSIYNGMVATAKYQSRHGYFLQASYVLSKSIDDNSAFFGSTGERTGVADANHINLERGPSSFDTRHHASILYSMDVPAGPGHRVFGSNNGFSRQVFGGWNVSGLVTAQTGQPFTVYDASQDYSGFNQFNDRPDVITMGPLPQNNRNPDSAFGTAGAGRGLGYFSSTPPTGRLGTSGRNQFYGPGLFNWDLAAAKTFPIWKERTRLQFRADFFNLFNHTNFANPIHDESSANFGKITQTLGSAVATSVGTTGGAYGAARQIQISMRLAF